MEATADWATDQAELLLRLQHLRPPRRSLMFRRPLLQLAVGAALLLVEHHCAQVDR